MCLGAIYWSRISKVYYAADRSDAANVGFDDAFIYDEFSMSKEQRSIKFKHLDLSEKVQPFQLWSENSSKIEY